MNLGCKKCEYMLANVYYKKSIDMYTVLADEGNEKCLEIIERMPSLKIDFDDILIAPFEWIVKEKVEEEYVPDYILDIEEDLDKISENILEDMVIEKEIK